MAEEKKAKAPAKPKAAAAAKPAAAKKAPAAKPLTGKMPVAPKAAAAKPAVKKEVAPKVEKPVAKKEAKVKGKAPYETNGEMTVIMVHGLQGCTKRQLATMKALGLKKIGDSKLHKDNGAIRGMVAVVNHLVKVEK